MEVVTHLQICRASMSGPDPKLIIWLLQTSQLLLNMLEI